MWKGYTFKGSFYFKPKNSKLQNRKDQIFIFSDVLWDDHKKLVKFYLIFQFSDQS